MNTLLPLVAALALSAPAANSLSDLLKRISRHLNAKPVKSAPRRAAVAAVRAGIPTEQGEDLDQRLLDRARALRGALDRKSPSDRDEAALREVYGALAASKFVQVLAIPEAAESKGEAAAALEAWAKEPRRPALPAKVAALLTGPASRIDDKALVDAGWGGFVRALTPAGAAVPPAENGYAPAGDAAKLEETIAALKSAASLKKLSPADEAATHLLAGQAYLALAAAELKGAARAPEASGVSKAAVAAAEEPAPAQEALPPFEPKAIYQKAAPATVLIVCGAEDGTGELGTGSIIDAARRRVLTNAHVVIRESSRKPWPMVRVYRKPAKLTGDSKRDLKDPLEAKVLAWDTGLDLALLELPELPAGAAALAFGHPDSVEVGDRVAAIGHPEQGGLWTLTTGVVSTLVADLGGVKGKDAFQTDASINRGNSGGPLLDAAGRLVGVNTLMSRKAADGLAITAVNFSVRSDVAKNWLARAGQPSSWGGVSAMPKGAALAAAPAPKLAPAPPPAMVAPEAKPAPAPAAAKPAPAPKRMMLTEGKPFDDEEIIAAQIREMEDLESEMQGEIRRRSGR